jgi:hypothetical protein
MHSQHKQKLSTYLGKCRQNISNKFKFIICKVDLTALNNAPHFRAYQSCCRHNRWRIVTRQFCAATDKNEPASNPSTPRSTNTRRTLFEDPLTTSHLRPLLKQILTAQHLPLAVRLQANWAVARPATRTNGSPVPSRSG